LHTALQLFGQVKGVFPKGKAPEEMIGYSSLDVSARVFLGARLKGSMNTLSDTAEAES